MLILMQSADEPRWVTVAAVIVVLALAAAALIIAFYVLAFAGGTLYFAFRDPVFLLKSFLVTWGVMSAVLWVLEADRVTYGWAAAAAMILALLRSALKGLGNSSL